MTEDLKGALPLSRRALMGGAAGMFALAGSEAMASAAVATSAPGRSPVADAAWRDYLRVIDEAREMALNSRWANTPQLAAQGQYYVSMLQAFGFNLYMAPRQIFPTFFSHTIFTPVEYAWGAPSPDFRYHWTAIDGRRTYRIWGKRGNTSWLDIQAQRGWWGDPDQKNLGNWDVDNFAKAPDGSFEIIASPHEHDGNWIRLDPTAHNICLLVRDIWDDWEKNEGATIHIDCIDRKPDEFALLSQEQIAERLGKIAFQTKFSMQWYLGDMDKALAGAGGTNRFWIPDRSTANLGGNPKAAYVKMIYDLQPDDALIIECELPNARYWSLQLADPWYQTTEYRFHQSSLNNRQCKLDADGKVRMVLSIKDPGVANWIDPGGLPSGLAQWRWYLSDRHPVPSVKKVPVGQLKRHLPASTAWVTPAERAAALAARNQQVMRRFNF